MRREAQVALAAAQEAAAVILRVYARPFDVEFKAKDDPVTEADRAANALLCERLTREFPGVPVVAEESDPASYAGFGRAGGAWFVDPLDGTREFVAKNGEFAVMVGLAEGGRASVGVVVAPVWGRAVVGVVGEGAWEIGANGVATPVHVTDRATLEGASILVSRSRTPPGVTDLIARLGARPAVPHGSSGLKGLLVATGAHDVYLHPGSAGMRWDACATDAVVRAAGGACTTADGDAIDYTSGQLENARGMVASNGKVHAQLIEALRASAPPRTGA